MKLTESNGWSFSKSLIVNKWNSTCSSRKSKGSGLNRIRNGFRKFSKKIGGSDKFKSPDRLNKRIPIFIKRNIYLKKKFKKRVKDHGIFCSCSSSPGSSTLCGSDCSCGHIKKMKLVQTEKCGYGIAADEDIKSGEFIIEFVEEVIDEKTCEETLLKMKHRVEANFYLCQINWNMVIDATYKGNKSRYFNHSCNPSTEMQKWIIDGETRVGIFAIRYITKGEHLTYDYQFVQLGADQDCYCGAVGCRKMLGANASKAKNIPSDEAVNLTACKGVSDLESPQEVRENNLDALGQSLNNCGERKTCCPNCIGVVFMLARPTNQRQFDEVSRKHLVTYEYGVTEAIDMSRSLVAHNCLILLQPYSLPLNFP
ncbi:hypothetical protein Bca52824_047567 [Brassica carinata]|uniref:Histone-lysine N-methyltransferase ASHH4 n=1 Tax=Brassica carinata TaxID=52824 RepID=A0A8X7REX1_BRACI|nr:hypothetical protein Bca52824_047567 [Brassica carinata]